MNSFHFGLLWALVMKRGRRKNSSANIFQGPPPSPVIKRQFFHTIQDIYTSGKYL